VTRPWSRTNRASPRPPAVRRVYEFPAGYLMDWMFDMVEETQRNDYAMGGKSDDKGSSQ
jgi:hypothetical protein